MKKRLLAALVSGALMMSALAGCGGSTAQTNNGGDTADQTTQQDYHIKVILKTLASEYWQYVGNGCKQAGEDLGVTVDVLGASSETAYDEQLSMIETTLSANDCDAMARFSAAGRNRSDPGCKYRPANRGDRHCDSVGQGAQLCRLQQRGAGRNGRQGCC